MSSRKIIKYLFIAVVIVAAGFATADSLGVFNSKPYTKVPHGSHFHYVPKNRNPRVGLDKFPMQKPLPGEAITPTGQIVPKDSLKAKSN